MGIETGDGQLINGQTTLCMRLFVSENPQIEKGRFDMKKHQFYHIYIREKQESIEELFVKTIEAAIATDEQAE